jgi:hypothetical protein
MRKIFIIGIILNYLSYIVKQCEIPAGLPVISRWFPADVPLMIRLDAWKPTGWEACASGCLMVDGRDARATASGSELKHLSRRIQEPVKNRLLIAAPEIV